MWYSRESSSMISWMNLLFVPMMMMMLSSLLIQWEGLHRWYPARLARRSQQQGTTGRSCCPK
jgi:hypothetical protein